MPSRDGLLGEWLFEDNVMIPQGIITMVRMWERPLMLPILRPVPVKRSTEW